MSIYTSPEARDGILAAYARRRAALPHLRPRFVDTDLARTHVLESGDEDAPVLLVFHGANGDALAMSPFGELDDVFRCVLVDVPGEPNPSAERILVGEELGVWVGQLLDALGLETASMLGMSGGGYVVLQAGVVVPDRIDRAVLLVPQGFVPIGDIPAPVPGNGRAFVDAITAPDPGFPDALLALVAAQMEQYFGGVRQPLKNRPVVEAEALARFSAPVFLVAGGADVIFPGREVIERAAEVLPELAATMLLPGVNHVHADLVGGEVLTRIRRFLTS